MKKIFLIIISVFVIFLLNTCALEIANVIGPDGGYVFYDKGNYSDGWRYIQCSPYDFGEFKDISEKTIREALRLCDDNSAEWHKFGWEIPTDAHLKKMLECFSYGLTKFSSNYYYLSVNELYSRITEFWVCTDCDILENTGKFCPECGGPRDNDSISYHQDAPPDLKNITDPSTWEPSVYHKNFKKAANGVVEIVDKDNLPEIIRLRPIRRF